MSSSQWKLVVGGVIGVALLGGVVVVALQQPTPVPVETEPDAKAEGKRKQKRARMKAKRKARRKGKATVVKEADPADVTAALAPAGLPLSAKQTDVLFLALCTLRATRMQPYGNDNPSSPFFQQLADSGVLFENNLSQAPWTRPSMGSLFTGRYPRGLGLDNPGDRSSFKGVLHPDQTLLAEHLKDAGYATAAVVVNPNLKGMFGFAQGFDAYIEPEADRFREEKKKSAHTVVDEALELAAKVPPDQRLYLKVNTIDTHHPIVPRPRFRKLMSGTDKLTEYDAALRLIDSQVARLVVELKKTRPNLLVVVAADHGEGLDWPEHHGHGHGKTVFRSTTHTPLIWHHPSFTPHRESRPTMNVDVVPTVLDLLGLPVEGKDGSSLKATIRKQKPAPHELVYTETFFREWHASSVFDGTDQLVRTYDGTASTDALYDDWRAEVDQVDRRSDVAVRLSKALTLWELQMDVVGEGVTYEPVKVDDTTKAMLEELGYIDDG